MAPLLPAVILAAFCIQGVAPLFYEVRGHLSSISAKQVEAILDDRIAFADYEKTARNRVSELLHGDLDELVIRNFEINGRKRPTAIFHAYLSTSLDRASLLSLVHSSSDAKFFYLKRIDEIPPLPSFASSVDAAATYCKNGGILLPNATCACPGFYSGDHCGQFQCLHYGIKDTSNYRCSCPPGVYSVNCESRACLPGVQDNVDNSKQTFIIVINQKISMNYIMNSIAGNMQNLITDINSASPGLIQNYIVVNYVDFSTGTNMQTSYFDNSDDFIDFLQHITAIDGSYEQPTNEAVLAAQSFAPLMRAFSNVFVFTDAMDSDGSAFSQYISSDFPETQLILKSIAWRNRIVYLISRNGNNTLETETGAYRTYGFVAGSTLGDVIPFEQREISTIMDPLMFYYQQNENIIARYAVQDTDSHVFDFTNEEEQQFVYALITVNPDAAMPQILGPDGKAVVAQVSGPNFQLIRTYNTVLTGITIKSSDSTVAWNLRIFVNSPKTVVISNVRDPKVDVGYAETALEASEQATAVLIGGLKPNSILLLSYYNLRFGQTTDGPAPAYLRNGSADCTFPLIFDKFAKPCIPGSFGQSVEISSAGTPSIRRMVPGFCANLDSPPATSFNCQNGGTKSGASSCICPPQFTAVDCSIPVCLNGGSVDQFPGNGRGLCLCPTGYQGDFCEILSCSSSSSDNFDTFNRTLALVIQTSMSQAQVNSKITNGISKLLGLMKGADAFNQYVLTTFNTVTRYGQQVPVISTTKYTSPVDFQTALQANNLAYTASQSTNQSAMEALFSTIRAIDYDKSSIFLFTDSSPADTLNAHDITMVAVEKQLEINVVTTPPFGMTDLCGGLLTFQYYTIVTRSGGTMMNLCNPYGTYSGDPIVQMFIGYGSSHHHTENVQEAYSYTCFRETVTSFVIEDPMSEVFAFVNSDNTESFTVSLVDNDYPDTAKELISIASVPFLGVYDITPNPMNVNGYTLHMIAVNGSLDGACETRIALRSQISATFGYASDPTIDSESRTMVYGDQSRPVVHVSSVLQSPSTVTMEIFNKGGSSLYKSVGRKRSSTCRYESYFVDPFVCTINSYDYLMTVTIQSSETTIQRTMRGYCYQPANECLHGGTFVNGTCMCLDGFYGLSCEYLRCAYDPDADHYSCQCDQTQTGELCQYTKCADWNYLETHDVRAQEFKQITFVLNINKNMLLPNIYLSNVIDQFVSESESEDVPKQYSLITFDETGSTNVVSTAHSAQFVSIFKSTVTKFTNTVPTATASLDALNEAFKINIDPPSVVFLFTGYDAAKPTQSLSTYLRQRVGTQVNIIYVPANAASPQQPAGNYGYMLSFAARQSGGRILPVTQNSLSTFDTVLSSVIRENALLHDDAAKDCTAGQEFAFLYESTLFSLVLDITGSGVSLPDAVTIRTEKGLIPITSDKLLFTDTAAMIITINSSSFSSIGGNMYVTVKTTNGSCFLQARASSPINVIPGFTSYMWSDFSKSGPFSTYGTNRGTYFTMRVSDGANPTTTVSVTGLSISQTDFQSPWQDKKPLLSPSIGLKDPNGCASQFISQLFTMPTATYQKYIVYGTDQNKAKFQRTFFFSLPAAADKAKTCVNGSRNTYGECVCDQNHGGDYCTDNICQNGGTQAGGICICINGYLGQYCERRVQ